MTQYKLFREVINRSDSENWDKAVLEWEFIGAYFLKKGEDYTVCKCGHYPIREVCVIRNILNGEILEVGNCCINHFKTDYKNIFPGYHRIKKDITKSASKTLILYSYKKEWLTEWDYNFYCNIFNRKKKLTKKQLDKKIQINNRIISSFERRHNGNIKELEIMKNEKIKWEKDADEDDAEVIKLGIGESVEGLLIDKIHSQKYNSECYKIKPYNKDKAVVLLGTTILDKKMKNKEIGQEVKIVRLDDGISNAGVIYQMYETFHTVDN